MAEPTGDKPKLIIDEDWKTQVEREREELRRAKEQSTEGTTGDTSDADKLQATTTQADGTDEQRSATKRPRGNAEADTNEIPPPPPATFPFLVSMLGTQALVAMGQLADDQGPEVRLDYAKHYIDLLGLLEEKTKGNLNQEETSLLFDWLHQLRLGFVEVAKRHSK